MSLNQIVISVFSNRNLTQPSPTPAGFSQTPTAGYPSRKGTFDFVSSNKVSVIKVVSKPEAAVPKETEKTSSVPPTETVTSERDEKFHDYWAVVKK